MAKPVAHPITVEVVRNSIVAYADEMANALCKAAYNMMIYEVRDFCCGLIDTQGRMISQNRGGLPIFLADLGAPCFVDGQLVAFAANRAHWVDIGGMRIGFGSSLTTEIFAEGLQMRSLKIYEAGVRNETLWQIINDNVRFPDASLGDLRAQVASCQLGARRYGELVSRYGRDVVEACVERVWEQADMAVRSVIQKIPDGVYEAESALDNDGRNLEQQIRIKVKVTIKDSTMAVDFSDMNPQTFSPLNSGKSGGIAAARVAFKALTSPELDVHDGCFRALDVVIPEGTIVSARPGAAIGLWSIALPTTIDTILKALAPALPNVIPAAHKGDMGGCSFYGFREDGSRFLLLNIFGGGWGGRPSEDGEDASVSVCQGDVRNTPVELQEIRYPMLIEEHALREDSGGAGQYRGGLGVRITYRTLVDCKVTVNCERTKVPPWGLAGGGPAAHNVAIIHSSGKPDRIVYKGTEIALAKGDSVTFLTAGGGGYGDPKKRKAADLENDVKQGFVSAKLAGESYGWRPSA